jgi:hypothetical protein
MKTWDTSIFGNWQNNDGGLFWCICVWKALSNDLPIGPWSDSNMSKSWSEKVTTLKQLLVSYSKYTNGGYITTLQETEKKKKKKIRPMDLNLLSFFLEKRSWYIYILNMYFILSFFYMYSWDWRQPTSKWSGLLYEKWFHVTDSCLW